MYAFDFHASLFDSFSKHLNNIDTKCLVWGMYKRNSRTGGFKKKKKKKKHESNFWDRGCGSGTLCFDNMGTNKQHKPKEKMPVTS